MGFARKQTLVVIGAGPKAMAIASKNAVLAEMGLEVPEIHIIEKLEVGANWTGRSGFTNGRLPLGTSPEKDVGFPYRSSRWGGELDARVNHRMRDYSWQSFLVESGDYSDWVDRGRPAPEHKHWAQYLQWVWQGVKKRTFCHRGEVTRLAIEDGRWLVSYDSPTNGAESIAADGIVVTGPGRTPLVEGVGAHDGLLTVESFWKRYERFRTVPATRLALVGTGENAAAIAMSLAELRNPALHIDIVSPRGMTFTRGESFRENRVYSDAARGNWEMLSPSDRREFIQRTDRGVFSVHAQSVLDAADGIDIVPGRVSRIVERGAKLGLELRYDGGTRELTYDFVVVATGADQLAFLRDLATPETIAEVAHRTGLTSLTQEAIEGRIDASLAVEGLAPRLHLPMLSGMRQGPGFANLSCLGRLSDHILGAYVGGGERGLRSDAA